MTALTSVFIVVLIVLIIFVRLYYGLKINLIKADKELEKVMQDLEQNQILHLACPDKDMESFLEKINDYIKISREKNIYYIKREKNLREQIENISHDLRTPLTSIIGYIELMDEERLCDDDRQMLQNIYRKSKSLQNLIGEFYDMSRLELNDYKLESVSVEVSRIIKESTLLLYYEFEKRNIEVKIDIEENTMEKLSILADNQAMERIINNMLQNAIRYAVSFLHISLYKENDKVCMVFANDTRELTAEETSHLFERFYMQEKSRTKQATGLGLTINKLLAEAMGGTVEAKLEKDVLSIKYEFISF